LTAPLRWPITAGRVRAIGVLREADRTVAAESVATLSLIESKRFLAALRKPFTPNAALRRALKRGNELGIEVTFSIEELEAKRHDRKGFDCGEELLNQYLRR